MNKEIAYHEAGHAVIGYLFYQPITSCTIVPENGRLGNTISEIPCPLLFGKFQDKYSSIDYFKIALYCWSGEYFQRIISAQIDEGGLVGDREVFDFYCNDEKLCMALNKYKQEILSTFFEDEEIHNMVNVIASNLLTQKTIYQSGIHSLLSQFNVNLQDKIDNIVEKFHELICDELQ